MTENKLTDKEIIKGLEECIELRFDDTEYATVKLNTLTNALDLINRLVTENENYSHNIKNLTAKNMQLHKEVERLNAKIKSVYEELQRIALMTVETDRNGV